MAPPPSEAEMRRFRLPLHFQTLCDELPQGDFSGSSIRIPRDPTPNVAALIAAAKLALTSKPKRKTHPPLSGQEMQAMLAKTKRRKPQQNATFHQADQADQNQHHVAAITMPEITPTCKLQSFLPILNVGLSKLMVVDEEAAPAYNMKFFSTGSQSAKVSRSTMTSKNI